MFALLVIALFVLFWFVPLNIVKAYRGHAIPALNFAIVAACLTYLTVYFFHLRSH